MGDPITAGALLVSGLMGMRASDRVASKAEAANKKNLELQERALAEQARIQREAMAQAEAEAARIEQLMLESAEAEQARYEQATNRANPRRAKSTDSDRLAARSGQASTMLTGPQGVNPDEMTLGRTSLLGG